VPEQLVVVEQVVRCEARALALPVGAPRVQQLGRGAAERLLCVRAQHRELGAVRRARARFAQQLEAARELRVARVDGVRAERVRGGGGALALALARRRRVVRVGLHAVGGVDVGERVQHLPLFAHGLRAVEQRRLGEAEGVRDRLVERGRESHQLGRARPRLRAERRLDRLERRLAELQLLVGARAERQPCEVDLHQAHRLREGLALLPTGGRGRAEAGGRRRARERARGRGSRQQSDEGAAASRCCSGARRAAWARPWR
jgi:hypothetical protein